MTDNTHKTSFHNLKNIFKTQFKKYWRYSSKWFPFAIVIGVISGVLMALFTSLVTELQIVSSYIPLFVRYPLIGFVNSLFILWGFKEVKGAGISFILMHKNTGKDIPQRTLFSKFISSGITLGFNAPAGREGPAVTLGSSVAALVGKKLKMTTEDITHTLTIGAAACTSAVFRTPLGGTVFAAEVPYKNDLDETVFLPALVASALALIISNIILDLLSTHPIYLDIETSQYRLTLPFAFHCILLGLIAGLVGIGFSLLFKLSERYVERKLKIWMLPVLGMLLSMIIIYIAQLSFPDVASLEGTGFHLINYILEHFATMGTGVLLMILLGKILATSFSIGMLNSGGVMGPSLVSGAALGALYANLFPDLNHIPMIVVGMAAMHTATTKTPIASMLLTLEMVGFPNLVIPIILANAMAFIISMDFSLYRGQVQSKEVILRRRIQHTDILETTTVKEAMIKKFPYIMESTSLQEISLLLTENKISALPVVVSPSMELKGIVSRADLHKGFSSQKKFAKEIMKKDVIVAYPEEPLNVVFDRLNDYRIETMPVVLRGDKRKVIGIITFREIEDCYEKRVLELHERRNLTMEELDEL